MPQERNTMQRQLVLDAVQSMHEHPTAEDIYNHIFLQYPNISLGTVYRNLSLLAARGEIRRVSHLNSADRFDFNLMPHYHFHCHGCGCVFDAPLPYDDKLLSRAAAKAASSGFLYEKCDTVFFGLCPDCVKNHEPAQEPES